MNDRLTAIRTRHKTKPQYEGAATYRQANADIGVLLDLLDVLLPAAQQASGLLEAIRMDTPWMVAPGIRELYQAIDEDFTAVLEAVTK